MTICKEELSANFQNFKITKNYRKGVRGRKLESYIFTWVPEQKNQQDIYYDSSIEDTNSVYYIKSNPFLTEKEKFRALDRFFGFTLGTSLKEYKDGHMRSYFLPNKLHNRKKRTVFHRTDLKSLSQYKHVQFGQLIDVYKQVGEKGFLTQEDKEDLALLEMGFAKTEKDREKDQEEAKERLKRLESQTKDLQARADSNVTLDFGQSGVETVSFFDDESNE